MNPYRFLPIKVALAALTLTLAARAAVELPQFAEVFTAGKDSFASIRIPSVVVTRAGTVLAFAEGRAVAADQANNKLILKRSADGGKTWGPLQIIADDGKNCLNNPCAVVVGQTGRIILMFQSYPFGFSERDGKIRPGLDGPAIVRNYVIHSDDDGRTWSPMADVTRTTKHAERVTILASGPGIGIQLRRGAHAGRILIPFNEGPFGHWNVLAVFSDDGGNHWHIGEPAPDCSITNAAGKNISLVNEVQMAELSDGSVMLNSRKWGGKPLRKIAVSKDAGVTWSSIQEEPSLRDPGCMASIFRLESKGGNVLLYSGPDSTKRENGTVHLSRDDGQTWPVNKVLFPGSFAYSVLTQLPDGDIGCLFETDGTDRIVFARFPLGWLTHAEDSLPSAQHESFDNQVDAAVPAVPSAPLPAGARLVFQEDWSSGSVAPEKWYTLRKKWGTGNNGVTPTNVWIGSDMVNGTRQNVLICEAHGDQYSGPVTGSGGQATRVGGVIATKQFFASGRYEVVMKVGRADGEGAPAQPKGAVPAIWTYAYRWAEVPAEKQTVFNADAPLFNPNLKVSGSPATEYWSEIDFPELGNNGDFTKGGYNVFCQNRYEWKTFAVPPIMDGKYHTYDMEWRTGLKPLTNVTDAQVIEYNGFWWLQNKTIPISSYRGNPLKRLGANNYAAYTGVTVQNRVDGIAVGRNTNNVPCMASQLTMGVWLPGWGGPAPWQTMQVSFGLVKIWQYDDPGDVRGILTEDVPPNF